MLTRGGAAEVGGKVFVVTGAGNGIGRRVAAELVRRGAVVVGVDLNEAGLAETSTNLDDPSRFHSYVLDIADAAAVAAFPALVDDAHGAVDGLFNIAGIPQSMSTVADMSDDRIETIMRVNFFGTVWMTRAFLPMLEARPDGGVIMNTSSLSAISPFPGAAFYGASKAAVALFGYSLAQDLRGTRSLVTITTVLPGTIWTDIVRDTAISLGQSEALARRFAMPADKAARQMIDATLRGKVRVVVGKDAHAFSGARRLSHRLAERMSYLQVGTFLYRRK